MSDPRFPELSPALVPLLIELKKYADARKEALANKEELPILSYLPKLLQKRTWQGKPPWPSISRSLEQGTCLVLFDGLDEVGNAEARKQIAGEINAFILEQRNTPPKRKTFNRFIITSRVAGYSPEAFPDVLPYRIAELTKRHMHTLLNLWYEAVLKAEPTTRESEARMQRLHRAIDEHGPIFRLAENPLLLMLMAAMQKYGINLPRERAELYDTIMLTLLKYREVVKDLPLPTIDEDEAVRRLGPLAYAMQTTEYIADEEAVRASLYKTISEERKRNAALSTQVSDPLREKAEIEKQVQDFLTLIRERSNLFVQRTGEDFSFFHKSFQEYFAARFILNTIPHKREAEIQHFVDLARQTDDLWREPFLFAVGYQSLGRGRDQTVARDLLQKLLEGYEQESDPAWRLHDLLLAADALVEAKAQTFDDAQEKLIAQGLPPLYLEAQLQDRFKDCQKIERAFSLWLLTLTIGDSQSPVLMTLCAFLQDLQRVDLQRATLTLLVMILAGEDYPQAVYEALIPHLLGLADLPELDQQYKPVPHTGVVDYAVADLALVALSRMGSHGPAGILLGMVRQHFEREPEQLRLLALYSLESQILLTLSVVPQTERLYQRYIKAVERWFTLKKRRERRPHRSINEDLLECLSIHQELLACAEEVRYPTSLHLLAMLKVSHLHQNQAWRDIWQTYLLQQISSTTSKSYIYYQEIILLSESLFPAEDNRKHIVELILEDYIQSKEPSNRFAQRFLATISEDVRDWHFLQDGQEWQNVVYWQSLQSIYTLQNIRYWRYWRYWRDVRELNDLLYWRFSEGADNWQEEQKLQYVKKRSIGPYWLHVKSWQEERYWQIAQDLPFLQKWQSVFLVAKTANKAIQLLSAADETEVIDLCTILLGRVLQIQKANERGQVIVEETQRIVEVTMQLLAKTSSTQKELRETLLDILRYLPARSGEEIAFVRKLAEDSADQEVQQALIQALRSACPHEDALPILQAAASSANTLVAEAAQQALESEKTDK